MRGGLLALQVLLARWHEGVRALLPGPREGVPASLPGPREGVRGLLQGGLQRCAWGHVILHAVCHAMEQALPCLGTCDITWGHGNVCMQY